MKTRVIALLFLLVVAFSMLPTAFAQDFTCFNLAAADCQLLQDANANSGSIKSSNYKFSITFNADLGQMGAMMGNASGKIDVKISGDGAFGEDAKANPPVALTMNSTADLAMGTEKQGGDLKVVVKDGVLYYNLGNTGWQGMKLEDVMKQFESMIPGGGAAMGGGAPDTSAIMKQLTDAGIGMEDIFGLITTPGLFDMKREADQDMDGTKVAPFVLTIDLIPVLKSPTFKKILDAAAKSDPSAAQFAALIPVLAEKSTFTITVTQHVGVDDKMMHGLALDIKFATDASVLMGAQQAMPITADFHFDVALSDLNAPVDIKAPEGAKMMASPAK